MDCIANYLFINLGCLDGIFWWVDTGFSIVIIIFVFCLVIVWIIWILGLFCLFYFILFRYHSKFSCSRYYIVGLICFLEGVAGIFVCKQGKGMLKAFLG